MRHRLSRLVPSAAVAALVLCGAAEGRTPGMTEVARPDSAMKLYRLEEVITYAESPQALGMVVDLRGEALLDRGGSDVSDLLRTDPGLRVTAGGKAETETRMRGMPGRATLVLVDGRPVNPGYYGKTDLSMITSSGVAAVQVVKGPASAAYGPNAMGGVINIITRSAFDDPGTRLGIRGGRDGMRQLSLGHSVRTRILGLSVHGYEQHRDGIRLSREFRPTAFEDGGLRTSSGYRKAGGGVKAGYVRDYEDVYTITLDYHWSRRDIPPTIYAWESPTWRRFPMWMRYGASLSNQRKIGSGLELVTVLNADGQHDRLVDYLDPSLSEDSINFDSLLRNRSYGGSVHLSGTIRNRHRVRAGLTYRHDLMNKRPDRGEDWDRRKLGTGSLFLENRFSVVRNVSVTGGLQTSLHLAEKQEDRRLALCPLLSLRWRAMEETALKATYTRAVRFPTLHRLYSVSSGNPDLRPEKADKYELGIERSLTARGLSAEVTWFRSDLTDMIDRPARSWQYENVESATISGVETAVRTPVTDFLEIEAGYTWISRSVSTREIMREQPEHFLGLGLTAVTPLGTRFRYDLTAQDERTSYVSDWMHPGIQLHNMIIRQPLPRGVTLRIEVSNLTDVSYQEELGYPAPGRTITAGFDWKLGGPTER